MKATRTKFVIVFLIAAFNFQFISNSALGPEVRLFPFNAEPFPGANSVITWQQILAIIIYPIKFILLAPLLPLFKLPDPPPPILFLAAALYWATIGMVLHYIINKINHRKKA